MAARSRGVVRMMTRTITTHPKGVNWKDLESGKLWEKKKTGAWQAREEKKNTYTYILTFAYGGTYK